MDSYVKSFFTSEHEHPDIELIKLIDNATKTIDIAIYTITKKDIVQAIINANNRGVSIRLILDKQEVNNKYEKEVISIIKDNNIPIIINKHRGLMHLKIIIVDDTIVSCGSYNYTEAASQDNDEVLLIIRELTVVNRFKAVFEKLWADKKRFINYY